VNVSYAGDRWVQRYSLFYAGEYVYGPGAPGETPPTGPGITPPVVETGKTEMTLEYPKEVNVSRGQSATLYMIVSNTGNRTLRSIRFLGSAPFPFVIDPTVISKLSPGFTGIFIISINIPIDIDEGSHNLNFNVYSDRTNMTGEIKINVQEISIKDEVWQTILNYRYLIERINGAMELAELEGKNVSEVRRILNEARGELKVAETLYFQSKYYEAKEQLKIVKERLVEAVRLLALLDIPLIPILLPVYISMIVILIVSVLIVIYFFFIYKKKKKKEESEG
jgi:hypothetical protein